MDLELDDDFMVVIVGDGSENEDGSFHLPMKIKEEVLDDADGILTSRQECENIVIVKEEILDEDIKGETVEYLNESGEVMYGDFIPEDSDLYKVEDEDEDYVPEEEAHDEEEYTTVDKVERKRTRRLLRPWQMKSFVKELREQYPELGEDDSLLVSSLAEIMRTIKPPPLPRDYFVMNDIMFQCVECSALSETIPAAGRHYQEKHGPRYLICFACGVDFRSTTNLYKHEKRCLAPDSEIVLRARAISVGNKGRARPFLQPKQLRPQGYKTMEGGEIKIKQRFSCDLCPGSFNNKQALVSHILLHQGLRPFRCTHCPCAYTSQSALSRHSKKHGAAKYVCEHCSRPFQVKAALVSHLDTHLPYRKHACEVCGRRFAQKSALSLHVDGAHRNLPPPCACQLCPKRFRRMTLLKNHMKKEHGMLLMTRKMFFKKLPMMSDTQIQQAKVVLKSDEPIYSVDKEEPSDPNEEFLSYLDQVLQQEQPEIKVVNIEKEKKEKLESDKVEKKQVTQQEDETIVKRRNKESLSYLDQVLQQEQPEIKVVNIEKKKKEKLESDKVEKKQVTQQEDETIVKRRNKESLSYLDHVLQQEQPEIKVVNIEKKKREKLESDKVEKKQVTQQENETIVKRKNKNRPNILR